MKKSKPHLDPAKGV